MATQRQLDVWIIDSNTVYRDVPFAVVVDWLQQGRLLPDDRVRLAGGKKWLPLTDVSAFAPYLPQQEPMAAEDAAEALEPVEMGLDWGKRRDEEEEDVDMIPLIDISLVLLIFFMMTASVASGILTPIRTPSAEHQLAEIAKDMYWVGVDGKSIAGAVEKDEDGKPKPWFSFGDDTTTLLKPTTEREDLVRALRTHLDNREGPVRIRIRGDVNMPIEEIQDLTLELQGLEKALNASRPTGKGPLSFVIYAEVSEPKR